jgi:hypothetical protein
VHYYVFSANWAISQQESLHIPRRFASRSRLHPIRTAQGALHAKITGMTKAELHELVDRLPDGAVDGAAVLLGEISAGRIDPEQAWFWTRGWQEKEREADDDLAMGRVTAYDTDAEFLAALDERTKPLDADA